MKVIIESMLREAIPRWELLLEVGFEGGTPSIVKDRQRFIDSSVGEYLGKTIVLKIHKNGFPTMSDMMGSLKFAFYWAASCGGCEITVQAHQREKSGE